MHLENISLINFKNYKETSFSFCPDINCILGDNGSGKTNLLDAVYYLSLTKSYFNTAENQNIRFGCDYFGLKGNFNCDGKNSAVTCKMKSSDRKEISLEGNIYERSTDHIGTFPVVMIAPDDTDIIRGGSDLRRRFFDGTLAQTDRPYLAELLKYNRALRRRNSLLKQFSENNRFDPDLIESYDRVLLGSGEEIYNKRVSLINRFNPLFNQRYEAIVGKKESVEINYLSDCADKNFNDTYRLNRAADRQSRRTLLGVHRDEFDFLINAVSLRKYGSQGQQKSFLIALKLTQYDRIRSDRDIKPILLLDDIFDKLDERRIQRLMDLVNRHHFGQIFITDARPERTLAIIDALQCEKKLIYLENGKGR